MGSFPWPCGYNRNLNRGTGCDTNQIHSNDELPCCRVVDATTLITILWIAIEIVTLRAATIRVYSHGTGQVTILYEVRRHGVWILLSKLAWLLFKLTSSITSTLADVLLLFLSRPKAMTYQLPHPPIRYIEDEVPSENSY